MRARTGLKATIAASMVVAMTTLGLPASAHDDNSEGEADGLEVEVRPAIATPSGVVTIAAEFELDDEDDDEDEDDEDDDEIEEEESEEEPDADETDEVDETDQTDSGGETDQVEQPADGSDEPAVAASEDAPAEAPADQTTEAPADETPADQTTETPADETDAPADQGDTRQGPPDAGVEFTVDFGDGSAAEPMRVAKRGGDEVKAFAKHAYAEAGSYTVTVTATPTGASPVSVPVTVQVGGGAARLGGKDRYETAAKLSREDFPTDGEADAVLLARSDAFADALAAASVAVLEQAPVLLTETAQVPASVLAEISRALGETGTVYLLGGESAISPAVAEALEAAGYDVVRLAGTDRVATSLQLAQFLLDAGVEVDEVVLASSTNFPDALAGAAYAGSAQAPVLLTAPGGLDPRVRDLLASLGKDVEVHVAGGSAAVSDAVLAQVAALGVDVERLSGTDRYDTAVQIAEALFPAPTAVALATGGTFPDALAGAAAAGRRDAPVLLVGAELPGPVRDYLAKHAGTIEAVYILGGEGVVSPAVMAQARQLAGL
jgi:putative cell wall-binding protein